jgi:hypothetical protein
MSTHLTEDKERHSPLFTTRPRKRLSRVQLFLILQCTATVKLPAQYDAISSSSLAHRLRHFLVAVFYFADLFVLNPARHVRVQPRYLYMPHAACVRLN